VNKAVIKNLYEFFVARLTAISEKQPAKKLKDFHKKSFKVFLLFLINESFMIFDMMFT
jgi:hypothetical protein